jgi:hypothetical protein
MIIFTSAATDFEVNHTPLASLVFPRRRMTQHGASELLQGVFGKEKNPCRLVYGCRKPSARHSSRVGSHFRGGGERILMRGPTARNARRGRRRSLQ